MKGRIEGVEPFPLHWPKGHKRSPRPREANFTVTVGVASAHLRKQLEALKSRAYVISTNVPVRRDGHAYAMRTTPDDPGVAVYWVDRRGRGYVMACDAWAKVAHNLRAVGLSIEALRGLGRWGCSEVMSRAFHGFHALPGQTAAPSWCTVLGVDASADIATIREAYHRQALRHHPDVGGSEEHFKVLLAAYESALRDARKPPA